MLSRDVRLLAFAYAVVPVACTLTFSTASVGRALAFVATNSAAVVSPSPIPVPPVADGAATDDVITQIRPLAPDKSELVVTNVSAVGYINTFDWTPPPGMTITAVTSSEFGRCRLSGNVIHCRGDIPPPSCTCAAGGTLTVNFSANGLTPTFSNGDWTDYGFEGSNLQVLTVTPVPYHIPSFRSGGV